MRQFKIRELIKTFKGFKDKLNIQPGIMGGRRRYKIDTDMRLNIVIDPAYFGGEDEFYYVLAKAFVDYFLVEDVGGIDKEDLINRIYLSVQFRDFVKKEIGIPLYVKNYKEFLRYLREER